MKGKKSDRNSQRVHPNRTLISLTRFKRKREKTSEYGFYPEKCIPCIQYRLSSVDIKYLVGYSMLFPLALIATLPPNEWKNATLKASGE